MSEEWALRSVLVRISELQAHPRLATADVLGDLKRELEPWWTEDAVEGVQLASGFLTAARNAGTDEERSVALGEATAELWGAIAARGFQTEAEAMEELHQLNDVAELFGLGPDDGTGFPEPR